MLATHTDFVFYHVACAGSPIPYPPPFGQPTQVPDAKAALLELHSFNTQKSAHHHMQAQACNLALYEIDKKEKELAEVRTTLEDRVAAAISERLPALVAAAVAEKSQKLKRRADGLQIAGKKMNADYEAYRTTMAGNLQAQAAEYGRAERARVQAEFPEAQLRMFQANVALDAMPAVPDFTDFADSP